MPKYLLILLLALLGSVSTRAEEAGEPLPTAEAHYKTLPRTYRLDGVVEAVNQGTVSAQTQGRVEEVLFDVDDFVEEGQLIARLRDNQQQAALRQAQAQLEAARAGRDEARDEYERVKGVFAKKMVAQAEMDRAEAALRSAEASFKAAKSGVDTAEEQLTYTTIRAPYAGIVTERHLEVGETANPGSPVMSGISLDKLRVNVDVPQRLIDYVREFREAEVENLSGGKVAVDEIVFFPYAHPGSNTFRVRLQLPAGVKGLMPGMYVKTSFVIGEEDLMLIPRRAVVYRSEVTGVYVVAEDGTIRFRRIRVGPQLDEGMIVVRAGLEVGEKVSTDPIRAGAELKHRQQERDDA